MKKHTKTIVFFPFEIGIAHITRSLAVAEELHKRGYKIYFVLAKRKQSIVSSSPVTFVHLQTVVAYDALPKTLLFFRKKEYISPMVQKEMKFLRSIHADLVVCDYQLTALASSAILGLKTIMLAHGSGLPYGFYIPRLYFPFNTDLLLKPFIVRFIELAKRWYLRGLVRVAKDNGYTKSLDEWFESVDFILPETRDYFSPQAKKLKLHFVGPLTWQGFSKKLPFPLQKLDKNMRTIYLSFGGTGFDPHKLKTLALTLIHNGYQVIVTTGTICDPSDFPKRKNLYVYQFLPGEKAMQLADLVICHGGYGTLIQAVRQQKPFITIAFNPDQIVHSLRMQELGLGICMSNFNLKTTLAFVYFALAFRWGMVEKLGQNMPVDRIIEKVERLYKHRQAYIKRLERYNKQYDLRDGARKAADIIERIVLKGRQ